MNDVPNLPTATHLSVEPGSEVIAQELRSDRLQAFRIAVLIPCFNEEVAVGTVVSDFHRALPDATIYVFDNNSTDRTCEVALQAGAVVAHEQGQGKGNVVRRMFADVEADVYVMVDGDATYDAASAPLLVRKLVESNFDMVVGRRISDHADAAYRRGHQRGNALLTKTVAMLFGRVFEDMLSGYRVFSRRFVKSFPALARGFEIEAELTVHALALSMPVAEVETPYYARPAGSTSKLHTYRDGVRILVKIVNLLKYERPLLFFGSAALLLAAISVSVAFPIFVTYFETGLVPRFPTAILATGLMLLAFLSLAVGLILDTVTHGRREAKRLAYLCFPARWDREAQGD